MIKEEKFGGGRIYMQSLNQKISRLVFNKPNTPALNYGRDTENKAGDTLFEFIKGRHKDIKLSDCGLFVVEILPYVGASPDGVLLCSFCEKFCMEIKCSYSMNYTKPCYSIRFIYKKTIFCLSLNFLNIMLSIKLRFSVYFS